MTNHTKDLRSWFCYKAYPESMFKEQFRRVESRTTDELLCFNSCVGKQVEVPFIVTYHSRLNGLTKIVRKNLKHL